MKRLLIVRHEEAHPSADEHGDALRALTSRGRGRMHKLAQSLVQYVTSLDHIWTSPLVRAVQTAEILQNGFDIHTPVSAHPTILAPPDFEVLRKHLESIGTSAMVGHEPTVGRFVAHLTNNHSRTLSFPTGQAMLLRWEHNRYSIERTFRGDVTIALS